MNRYRPTDIAHIFLYDLSLIYINLIPICNCNFISFYLIIISMQWTLFFLFSDYKCNIVPMKLIPVSNEVSLRKPIVHIQS